MGAVTAAAGPAACRLTARDRALLHRLAEHEPLTTSELRLLFFTGESRCRRRLRTLHAEGLLARVFPARPHQGGSMEALWFLSTEGRRLLGAPGRRGPGLSLPDLEHRRAVARFFCALVEHSLTRSDQGLWSWHGERRCHDAHHGQLRPDGYGRYLHPHGEISFYLELDRGTEPQTRLRAKLDAYLHQLAGSEDARYANVLLIVQGRRRLRGLLNDPALDGPPWLWASTDTDRYALLASAEERGFIELPAFPRDSKRRLEDCLGRHWQQLNQRPRENP